MKKLLLATVATMSLSFSPSHAAGILTFDAAGLAQAVEQYNQMLQQYQMLQNQYNELTTVKDNLMGITNFNVEDLIGNLSPELQTAIDFYSDPDSVKNQLDALIDEKYNKALAQYTTLEDLNKAITESNKQRNVMQEQQGLEILSQIEQHRKNLDSLTRQLATASTAKESSDITARINAENAAINALVTSQQAAKSVAEAQAERNSQHVLQKAHENRIEGIRAIYGNGN